MIGDKKLLTLLNSLLADEHFVSKTVRKVIKNNKESFLSDWLSMH